MGFYVRLGLDAPILRLGIRLSRVVGGLLYRFGSSRRRKRIADRPAPITFGTTEEPKEAFV